MKLKKLAPAVLIFLLSATAAFAQTDYVGSALVPAHPRILLLKGEEATIKKTIQADKIWGKLQQAILDESSRLIDVPPVERIQIGRRLLDKSREALRRLFF